MTSENPALTDEYREITPEGNVRWEPWMDRAIFDDEGNVIEYQSVGRDITKRKLAEEALQQRTAELEMFNKAMVDREMRIIEMKEEVNSLYEELGREPAYPPISQDSDDS